MSIYGEGLYREAGGRLVEGIVSARALSWSATSGSRRARTAGRSSPCPPRSGSSPGSHRCTRWASTTRSGCACCSEAPTTSPRLRCASSTSTARIRRSRIPTPAFWPSSPTACSTAGPPLVFEDGEQRRDFVSVHDVARACCLALHRDGADGEAVNVGTGQSVTVNQLARQLAEVIGTPEIEPRVTSRYRVGDIRHCFADIERARADPGIRAAGLPAGWHGRARRVARGALE